MSNNAYKRASLLIQKAKGPKWKRELVSDHKFDFIDIEEFRDRTCLLTIKYFILLCSVLISGAVYCADLGSAGILLIYNHWSLSTQPKIPFYISKWIYVGCIAISFMLLAWEIRKTRNVMETRDISLAVTNPLAYRTYSVKSYSHFCLLQKIKSSTKWSDVVIFYVFYTLKGWKRVIVAQGPRQIIAGITVFALLQNAWTKNNNKFEFSTDWNAYGTDWPQRVSLMLMSFTCVLWVLSALQIGLAVLLYIPILCQIQGNLKEYCCHKIDKRIDELLEKQRKKRIREREKYAHSITSKKSKNSGKKFPTDRREFDAAPPLPTLPVIGNIDLYAKENTNNPWIYQQPQSNNSYYYENQPMTPLESNYSLQRNTTRHNPYSATPHISQQQRAYTSHQRSDMTSDYYYPGTVRVGMDTFNTDYYTDTLYNNKPHAYEESPIPLDNVPNIQQKPAAASDTNGISITNSAHNDGNPIKSNQSTKNLRFQQDSPFLYQTENHSLSNSGSYSTNITTQGRTEDFHQNNFKDITNGSNETKSPTYSNYI